MSLVSFLGVWWQLIAQPSSQSQSTCHDINGWEEGTLSLLVWHCLEKHPHHFLPSFPAVGKAELKSKWLCWIPRDSPHFTTLGKAPPVITELPVHHLSIPELRDTGKHNPESSLGGGNEQTKRTSMRTVRQLPKKPILRKPSDSGCWPCQHEDITALCSHGNLGKRVCICNSLTGFA